MLHRASFCSEVIRSDSRWKVLLHPASEVSISFQIGAGNSKLIQYASKRAGLRSGKVEFCLPTKLRATSLTALVIDRASHTLNAFGLFARAKQAFLLDHAAERGLDLAKERER
jgi:hypothetical protein